MRAELDPCSLLLVFPVARRSQQRYEVLRLAAWNVFPHPLPPNASDFVWFDKDWLPQRGAWRLHEDWDRWSTDSTVDYDLSFSSFMASFHAESARLTKLRKANAIAAGTAADANAVRSEMGPVEPAENSPVPNAAGSSSGSMASLNIAASPQRSAQSMYRKWSGFWPRIGILLLVICIVGALKLMPQRSAHRKSGVPAAPVRGVAGPTKKNDRDGAEMVFVPAGQFTMGDRDQSDNYPHQVTLSGFYIYKDLVTVAQYGKFCSATGHKMPEAPSWGWNEDHPIVNVSWNDAQAYCQWAGVRLPTEAEWEKAARGTDGRQYPWGDAFDSSRLQCSKSATGDAKSTAPVGSFPSGASPYGALDMAGNVLEWCADWYDQDYTKKSNLTNPSGPKSGNVRVLRGGSWYNDIPVIFRASFRDSVDPASWNFGGGFRCASED